MGPSGLPECNRIRGIQKVPSSGMATCEWAFNINRKRVVPDLCAPTIKKGFTILLSTRPLFSLVVYRTEGVYWASGRHGHAGSAQACV